MSVIKRPTDELPPRIPEAIKDLERAVLLLGNRWRTDLNPKARKELETLVGKYPSKAQAALWKSALRALREEMVELGD
jgi:hypothetical protein